MPNNPNNARSLLNLIKPPAQATPAPQAAIPTLSAEEARVQKAYEALGISPPIGTPQNPVKMQAGGVIGNIGMLNAVRLGIQPKLTPEQEAYMDQYNTYADQYNSSYTPAYEQYVAQQNAWADAYNKAQQQYASGAGRVTVPFVSSKMKLYQNQGYLIDYGASGGEYATLYLPFEKYFTQKEPTFSMPEPTPPALPEGYTTAEEYQTAVGEEARAKAKRTNLSLAAFSNPQGYNLAGFGGAATFKDGGDVKKSAEAGSKLDPVYVETESLRNQIEAGLPKDKYFETYPVRIVDTMKNARDTEGGVTRPYGEPGVVNINPKGNFKDKYGTFEHERQHLIDAKRGKTELRYPAPEYIPEDAKYNKPTVPVDKELQFKTKNDIYSAFQKYRKELGLAADFVEEGFFAEIRSIEKGLPAGKSILDTNIGKDLFANNPELLQTYWSRTRPEFTTYMTEQRDSPRYKMNKRTDIYKEQPKTTEKGTLTKVQDFIRSKTNN